jgi:hypothetical protein
VCPFTDSWGPRLADTPSGPLSLPQCSWLLQQCWQRNQIHHQRVSHTTGGCAISWWLPVWWGKQMEGCPCGAEEETTPTPTPCQSLVISASLLLQETGKKGSRACWALTMWLFRPSRHSPSKSQGNREGSKGHRKCFLQRAEGRCALKRQSHQEALGEQNRAILFQGTWYKDRVHGWRGSWCSVTPTPPGSSLFHLVTYVQRAQQ